MNHFAKKITLLTLISVIQLGFAVGFTEASPLHTNNDSSAQVQFYEGPGDPGPGNPNELRHEPPRHEPPRHEPQRPPQPPKSHHHWWDL